MKYIHRLLTIIKKTPFYNIRLPKSSSSSSSSSADRCAKPPLLKLAIKPRNILRNSINKTLMLIDVSTVMASIFYMRAYFRGFCNALNSTGVSLKCPPPVLGPASSLLSISIIYDTQCPILIASVLK